MPISWMIEAQRPPLAATTNLSPYQVTWASGLTIRHSDLKLTLQAYIAMPDERAHDETLQKRSRPP